MILYPLCFFVLDADLLQSLVYQSKEHNLSSLRVPMDFTQDFPIIQYVDDSLVVMEGCHIQHLCLKRLLEDFAIASCLKVNYS